MDYIKRPCYVQQLERWKDRDLIKVVTGVRRCGKSTVLEMFRGKLRRAGVSDNQMVALNFEDPDMARRLELHQAAHQQKGEDVCVPGRDTTSP